MNTTSTQETSQKIDAPRYTSSAIGADEGALSFADLERIVRIDTRETEKPQRSRIPKRLSLACAQKFDRGTTQRQGRERGEDHDGFMTLARKRRRRDLPFSVLRRKVQKSFALLLLSRAVGFAIVSTRRAKRERLDGVFSFSIFPDPLALEDEPWLAHFPSNSLNSPLHAPARFTFSTRGVSLLSLRSPRSRFSSLNSR